MRNMKYGNFSFVKKLVTAIIVIFALGLLCPRAFLAEEITARPSTSGALSVTGTRLYDSNQREVSLKGVSTHGINWFPDYINQDCFDQLSKDWNSNIIRVALYSDDYCKGDKEHYKNLMKSAIEYAINSDMYIIVDWHVLDEADPNVHIDEAKSFFFDISVKYADTPNVIYEICNEPNSGTTWEDISAYANVIIPVIRFNNPDSVIIVGTPDYDKELDGPLSSPLDYKNVMYAYHFYTSSHGRNMRDSLEKSLNAGLPVFISECGIVDEKGDGTYSSASIEEWFSLVEKYNLPHTIWSFCNKDEAASMIKGRVSKTSGFFDRDLTYTGRWVKAHLRGEEAPPIEINNLYAIDLKVLKAHPLREFEEALWPSLILIFIGVLIKAIHTAIGRKKHKTYNDIIDSDSADSHRLIGKILASISILFSTVYLVWRIFFSLPYKYGVHAIVASVILLLIEIWGFFDTLSHYMLMLNLKKYKLPHIEDDEYPDVDIFIATYNEPEELLFKTVNGCLHLDYPDKSKVHIYLCDDNRRANIKALAEKMGVGYFDRPDNEGAKAGNLNNALFKTTSPYVVTLDADMIPRRMFLMQTIPYYVDNEKRNRDRREEDKITLGLLQTPQAFYSPDVFEHNLYCETRVPNEQDFFYRTIEVSRTATNSVIYGGSNTVILRKALEDIGGFYTKSITEDFATGLLIESKGYVSLGLGEPLCSGMSPFSFKDYVQQRIRWGRGVINTAKDLHILRNKNLSVSQKTSYLSSVSYWYSSIKNLIFIMAPLVFATFGIPVMDCAGLEILLFWLPMYASQTAALRIISGGSISSRRAGIQETCMMPFMIKPIVAETFGKSLKKFEVTSKDSGSSQREVYVKWMIPFLILIGLSIVGIVRVTYEFARVKSIGLVCVLFWLLRNIYFMLMSLYLCDGRPFEGENVEVKFAEFVEATTKEGEKYGGVTTCLTEHSVTVFLDDETYLKIGQQLDVAVDTDRYHVELSGIIVKVRRKGKRSVYTVEILDFKEYFAEYLQILYDREPTLPQRIRKDRLYLNDLWYNFIKRVDRE